MVNPLMRKRGSGLFLHITSLPSAFGVGDLGPEAFKFADLLSRAKQACWMILPLSPTSIAYDNSPYKASSAFAGNPLLISPEFLAEEGFLPVASPRIPSTFPSARVDYPAVAKLKGELMKKAFNGFRRKRGDYHFRFEAFCEENAPWLEEFALYTALRKKFRKPWHLWPAPFRDRHAPEIRRAKRSLGEAIEFAKFVQFIFFEQWHALKQYCGRRGIRILGDLPFYVAHDGADAWAHPGIFRLDSKKKPSFVGGVPPDYFSQLGQLWGTPVYNWDQLADQGFDWWISRIKHSLKLFDLLRLDHFRGFLAYWEVPARNKTAIQGSWVKIPSQAFFNALVNQFPSLPFIAEDLGVVTPDVKESLDRLGLPGMRVLLFAFSGPADNPHNPHNYVRNSVAYTGTHDTNTAKGWFVEEASAAERSNLFQYLGRRVSKDEVSGELIRIAMSSMSNLTILTVQDVLGLGAESRMNRPYRADGNWEWRATGSQLESGEFGKLKELAEATGR